MSTRSTANTRSSSYRLEYNAMTNCRIALANLRVADTPEASVELAVEAIADAGRHGVQIICFPECFIPGYR